MWDESEGRDDALKVPRPPLVASFYPSAFSPLNTASRFDLKGDHAWQKLFVTVGGTNLPKLADEGYRERVWKNNATTGSNFGHHVSLAAPAERLRVARLLNPPERSSGTPSPRPKCRRLLPSFCECRSRAR